MFVRDAIPWVLIPVLAALALLWLGLWWLSAPLLLVAAFMAYFFRDPRRAVPAGAGVVVSPADGRVTRVEKVSPADPDSATVVSIFLSPFDVHINRSPIAGQVTSVNYTKGRFMIATRDEASLVNEQNSLTIRGEKITVTCKQIAGVLARRIVCWKRAGDTLELGERFGLIKFGSRTDLTLPAQVEVLVEVGARVRGGVSLIGRIRDGG
ncbi:MAG TPA: phosphatidylserine decarboxylase family protein [Pyrinomonadaceae bacterium]|nr:phosphatidylserine decarboxylase family protein [Pyrinomonadaceae bacterium]